MSRKRATSATMATEPAYDTVIRRIERLRIPETTIWLAEYGDTNHTYSHLFTGTSARLYNYAHHSYYPGLVDLISF